jgi:hypothetical protein
MVGAFGNPDPYDSGVPRIGEGADAIDADVKSLGVAHTLECRANLPELCFGDFTEELQSEV